MKQLNWLDGTGITNMTEEPNLKGQFDGLLSKYILVWLWSILFGGSTATSYTLFTYHTGVIGGVLHYALSALTWSGILLLVLAWVHLYKFLTLVIIPIFIHGQDIDKDDHARKFGAHVLGRAFLFMLLAGFLGLSSRALQTLFQ